MKTVILEATHALTELSIKVIEEVHHDTEYYTIELNGMEFSVHTRDEAIQIFNTYQHANNTLELAVL